VIAPVDQLSSHISSLMVVVHVMTDPFRRVYYTGVNSCGFKEHLLVEIVVSRRRVFEYPSASDYPFGSGISCG